MKTAAITGASRGIGKAIAEKFASEGFNLVLSSRSETALFAFREELALRYPHQQFNALAADLSEAAETRRLADFITLHAGSPDVLVNNCGIYLPGEVHNEPEGRLLDLLNTNLLSAYNLTRALIAPMKLRRSGHIINICSTASIQPYPNGGSYAITKFALYGFTQALREELKTSGVRVTAILPGPTLTDSWAGAPFPESRLMKASDIGEAVYGAYKLSDYTVVEQIILRPQEGDLP